MGRKSLAVMEKRQKWQVLDDIGSHSLNSARKLLSCIGCLSVDLRQQQHSAALLATKQPSLGPSTSPTILVCKEWAITGDWQIFCLCKTLTVVIDSVLAFFQSHFRLCAKSVQFCTIGIRSCLKIEVIFACFKGKCIEYLLLLSLVTYSDLQNVMRMVTYEL